MRNKWDGLGPNDILLEVQLKVRQEISTNCWLCVIYVLSAKILLVPPNKKCLWRYLIIQFSNIAIAVAIVERAITIRRAVEKRSHESKYKNRYKKRSKRGKSDNFCYLKVGRAITKYSDIKSYFAYWRHY